MNTSIKRMIGIISTVALVTSTTNPLLLGSTFAQGPGESNLIFEKVDENSDRLAGAEFTAESCTRSPDGVPFCESLNNYARFANLTNTGYADEFGEEMEQRGSANETCDGTEIHRVNIEESNAPDGYEGVSGEATLCRTANGRQAKSLPSGYSFDDSNKTLTITNTAIEVQAQEPTTPGYVSLCEANDTVVTFDTNWVDDTRTYEEVTELGATFSITDNGDDTYAVLLQPGTEALTATRGTITFPAGSIVEIVNDGSLEGNPTYNTANVVDGTTNQVYFSLGVTNGTDAFAISVTNTQDTCSEESPAVAYTASAHNLTLCEANDVTVTLNESETGNNWGTAIMNLDENFVITETENGYTVKLLQINGSPNKYAEGTITLPETATNVEVVTGDDLEGPDSVEANGNTINFYLQNNTADDTFYINFTKECPPTETTTNLSLCEANDVTVTLNNQTSRVSGDNVTAITAPDANFSITETAEGYEVNLVKTDGGNRSVEGTITLPAGTTGVGVVLGDNMETGTREYSDYATVDGNVVSFGLFNNSADDTFTITFDKVCNTTMSLCETDDVAVSLNSNTSRVSGSNVSAITELNNGFSITETESGYEVNLIKTDGGNRSVEGTITLPQTATNVAITLGDNMETSGKGDHTDYATVDGNIVNFALFNNSADDTFTITFDKGCEEPMGAPFACDETIYVTHQTAGTNPAIFFEFDPMDLSMTQLFQINHTLNAVAQSPKDGYMYGIELYTNNLIKIDANGNSVNLGPVTNLPDIDRSIRHNGYVYGEITPDGLYYVRTSIVNPSTSSIYEIDLEEQEVIRVIQLSKNVGNGDFAYSNTLKKLVTMDRRLQAAFSIDIATGEVENIGQATTPVGGGGLVAGSNGMIYSFGNAGTDVFYLNEKIGNVTKIGANTYYTQTDAAHCVTAAVHGPLHPPVITLTDAATITLTAGDTFTDPGATADDTEDGDITTNVVISGNVDVNTPGTYTLTYTVTDSHGNTVSTERTVVVNPVAPVEVNNNLTMCTTDDVVVALSDTGNSRGTAITNLTENFSITETEDGYMITLVTIDGSPDKYVEGTITLPEAATNIEIVRSNDMEKKDYTSLDGNVINFGLFNNTADDTFYINFTKQCEEDDSNDDGGNSSSGGGSGGGSNTVSGGSGGGSGGSGGGNNQPILLDTGDENDTTPETEDTPENTDDTPSSNQVVLLDVGSDTNTPEEEVVVAPAPSTNTTPRVTRTVAQSPITTRQTVLLDTGAGDVDSAATGASDKNVIPYIILMILMAAGLTYNNRRKD